MSIWITGGSGNVGSLLMEQLEAEGYKVVNFTRSVRHSRDKQWNPQMGEMDVAGLESPQAVINLAGYSVSNHWTEENKREMRSSRMTAATTLLFQLKKMGAQPKVWINASAIGIYRSTLEWQDEQSPKGSGFLADLTQDWEDSILGSLSVTTRVVILRIGVVMHAQSGALQKMIPLFKWGLGSALGKGEQWMSWIDRKDLSNMIVWSLKKENVNGVYNAVAPNPVTNKAFSQALCKALNRPMLLPNAPTWVLKIIFGEMASMVLNSQRISAQKIMDTGFAFQYPDLESCLKNQLDS
jgi:uncharacterized protein (TIGR01777 family)